MAEFRARMHLSSEGNARQQGLVVRIGQADLLLELNAQETWGFLPFTLCTPVTLTFT